MIIKKMASSVTPDEMTHYEQSNLNLHCLNRYLYRFKGRKGLLAESDGFMAWL